jgi:hypothetical protein
VYDGSHNLDRTGYEGWARESIGKGEQEAEEGKS